MTALTVRYPSAWALAACALAAALEAALAGGGASERLAELVQPPFAPPLPVWAAIGALYYLLFFFIIRSLLGTPPTPRLSSRALVLAAALLAANAAWNWLFFREKDLWLSLMFYAPYGAAALMLAFTLWRLGSPMFVWFVLYLLYFPYAAWWGFALWRLNGGDS